MGFRIDIEWISKRYGEFTALREVRTQFAAGERISVLGHNGAGKTTLLELIATLSRPNEGEIHYFEDDTVLKDKVSVRGNFTYLGHQPMLYPDLTALENLRFAARLYGCSEDKAHLMAGLAQVGMESEGDRLVRTCSRGMKQRIALARALLPQPRFLLLDEPFTGLDNEGVARVVELLRDRSWIMVTHDLELGFQLASRFWILREGKLIHTPRKEDLTLEDYLDLCRVPLKRKAS